MEGRHHSCLWNLSAAGGTEARRSLCEVSAVYFRANLRKDCVRKMSCGYEDYWLQGSAAETDFAVFSCSSCITLRDMCCVSTPMFASCVLGCQVLVLLGGCVETCSKDFPEKQCFFL